mmetsp:Transcript_1878/g.4763  ORF Transcript_1878/g.4763 Transcript_1878/m.4763 type:complete len:305 (+) Transcript_1878:547-1461(+)
MGASSSGNAPSTLALMPSPSRSFTSNWALLRYFLSAAKASIQPGWISPVISIDLAATIVLALRPAYTGPFARTAFTRRDATAWLHCHAMLSITTSPPCPTMMSAVSMFSVHHLSSAAAYFSFSLVEISANSSAQFFPEDGQPGSDPPAWPAPSLGGVSFSALYASWVNWSAAKYAFSSSGSSSATLGLEASQLARRPGRLKSQGFSRSWIIWMLLCGTPILSSRPWSHQNHVPSPRPRNPFSPTLPSPMRPLAMFSGGRWYEASLIYSTFNFWISLAYFFANPSRVTPGPASSRSSTPRLWRTT